LARKQQAKRRSKLGERTGWTRAAMLGPAPGIGIDRADSVDCSASIAGRALGHRAPQEASDTLT
jgi:hypothetical protein